MWRRTFLPTPPLRVGPLYDHLGNAHATTWIHRFVGRRTFWLRILFLLLVLHYSPPFQLLPFRHRLIIDIDPLTLAFPAMAMVTVVMAMAMAGPTPTALVFPRLFSCTIIISRDRSRRVRWCWWHRERTVSTERWGRSPVAGVAVSTAVK